MNWFCTALFRHDLETYSEAHLIGCNLVDPDMNGGELNIKIPAEAHAGGLVAEGKLVRVGVEFSLEDPQGGVHFVVPEGPPNEKVNSNNQSQALADRAAHLFTCGHENSSRYDDIWQENPWKISENSKVFG